MKKAAVFIIFVNLTGCAYLHDRGRDACDVFTLSLEVTGLNASAQIGPAVVGAGVAGGKGIGLRSGALGVYEFGELNFVLFGTKILIPDGPDIDREKGYEKTYTWAPWKKKNDTDMEIVEGKWFNSWQIELAVIAGVGARLGVNLAELFDFVLGWTTLDICDDDIAALEWNR